MPHPSLVKPCFIPIIVKDRVPRRLLEATLIDGAEASNVVYAQLIGGNANYGAEPAVGVVKRSVLSVRETNLENPKAREGSGPVSIGYPCKGREKRRIN